MPEAQQQAPAGTAPVPNAGSSEEVTAFDPNYKDPNAAAEGSTGTSDTPEEPKAVETDEQKNARLAEASKRRSETRRENLNTRINELTAERYAEKARADALERQLMAQYQNKGAAPQPQGDGAPRREQFNDYESYLEARAEWRAATAFQRMSQEANARGATAAQAQQAEQQLASMQQNIKASVSEFVKSHPDYHDVIEAHDVDVPVPATLAIGTHKEAAAIMYHLGQNPDLIESLQSMHPVQQIATIGEIAASVRSSPQVSKAPRPGQPVGAKPGSSDTPPEDTAAYMAWADKHMK